MKISKYFRPKNKYGSFDEEIYFAVDSDKVDFEDGQNLKEKMEAANFSISSLQSNYEQIDADMNNAEDGIKTQIIEINDRVSVVAGETSDLKQSLSTANAAITSLQKGVDTLTTKTNTLEGEVQSNSKNISSLQDSSREAKEEIESIQTILSVTCRMESTSLTCTLPDNL